MLDADLKSQLQAYLEKVVHPIELVASLDGGQSSQELKELLEDIAPLSDMVSLRLDGTDARKPSFAINRTGTDVTVRFAGGLRWGLRRGGD